MESRKASFAFPDSSWEYIVYGIKNSRKQTNNFIIHSKSPKRQTESTNASATKISTCRAYLVTVDSGRDSTAAAIAGAQRALFEHSSQTPFPNERRYSPFQRSMRC